jgi:glycosyltransferase involved in cell wall biosynthesis
MIFFDTTKTGAAGHRSGLMRVSTRLREAFGPAVTAIRWDNTARAFADADGRPGPTDWFLTAELFSEEERPGFTRFIEAGPGRKAAIFHDAIPLRHPHITWPQSVARHPAYLKQLARFDRVWAVSRTSRDDLVGYWSWLGLERTPPVDVLALGADFNGAPRVSHRALSAPARPQLLCVGILEPRKNQGFLLDVCEELWGGGLDFELHVVGRVNPHFGAPLAARLKSLQHSHHGLLHFHEAADDALLARLFATVRATVFPTLAEGCGLPLLESLWMGVPCVCSDLPVLRENADAGGCLTATLNDRAAWVATLRRVLTDDTLLTRLTAEATTRLLPTWRDAAATLTAEN